MFIGTIATINATLEFGISFLFYLLLFTIFITVIGFYIDWKYSNQ